MRPALAEAMNIVVPKLERVEEILKVDNWMELFARRTSRVTHDSIAIDYAHMRNTLDLLRQAEACGFKVGAYPKIKALLRYCPLL